MMLELVASKPEAEVEPWADPVWQLLTASRWQIKATGSLANLLRSQSCYFANR
jgi:hypothetical protein